MRYTCDEDLRAKVLSIPGVQDLVGGRLYADVAPQKPTSPYGTLTMVGDAARSWRLNAAAMKTLRARYQFDWYGPDKRVVREIAARVSASALDGGLDGFRGQIGTTQVQMARVENRRDDSWDPESAGEARVYQCGFDLVIVFNE